VNSQGPSCRRCKADLSLLFTLEARRLELRDAARRSFAAGDLRSAAQAAESADRLQSDSESLRLVALVRLLNRDFATAWDCYHRATDAPGNAASNGRLS
jgi:hypothetical protein